MFDVLCRFAVVFILIIGHGNSQEAPNVNYPSFTNLPYTGEISRSQYEDENDFKIDTICVEDLDEDEKNLEVIIEDDQVKEKTVFELKDGDNDGCYNLILSGSIAQDTSKEYKLTIKATDSGGKSNTVEVPIDVDDPPKWELSGTTYVVCMKGANEGDSILVLKATDPDTSSSDLGFSFKVVDEDLDARIFNLDGNVLKTTAELLALVEEKQSIGVTLSVFDGETTPVDADITVKLEKDRTPDNIPQFVNPDFGTAIAVEGKENGDTVIKEGFGIIFECQSYTYPVKIKLSSDGHDGEFVLTNNKLKYGAKRLNYDDKKKYDLKLEITIEEGMKEGDKQTATLIVEVETAPAAENLVPYQIISVLENEIPGTIVYTIQAIDKDGDNTDLKISAKDPDANEDLFIVAGNDIRVSNNIKAEHKLDVENPDGTKSFPMVIRLTDGKYEVSIPITLVPEDVNDNPPIFTEASPLSAYVVEDAEPGTTVTCFTAEDADSTSPNNDIYYTLPEDLGMFGLTDVGTCLIVSNPSRVYFSQTPLILEVVAADGGQLNTVKSATLQLEITTEARPVFTLLSTPQELTVSENSGTKELYELEATDNDTADENLEFSVEREQIIFNGGESAEDMSAYFPIVFHNDGKALMTQHSLDAEVLDKIILTFAVTDGKYKKLSEALTVYIGDINDNAPSFKESYDDIRIDENHIIGTPAERIEAFDDDRTSPFNVVTYAINTTDDNGVFKIDEKTGDFVLVKTPMEHLYQYVVSASDGGDPPLETNVSVRITVNPDVVDECAPIPCKNGATCFQSVNYYKCMCTIGWTGQNCETNIDDCSDEYCKNNGTCVDEVNAYSCNCAVGWTGDSCEENIDDCKENSCQNGGTCNDQINSFTCTCPPEWTGEVCEEDIDCDTFPCENGATCVPRTDVSAYFCTCTEGWTGRQCQTNIDDCSEDPCNNGGTCIDEHDGFTCNCSSGWHGDTCETGCTGNTYGRNCKEKCICDLTDHLSDPNEDQICDIKTGDCNCNSKWIGGKCDKDVDECEQDDICNSANNRVCENSDGAYECVCKVGYLLSVSSKCSEDKRIQRLLLQAKEISVLLKIILNSVCPKNLDRPSVYGAFKDALTRTITSRLTMAREVMLSNIRCGSVIFDMEVAVSEASKGALAIQIQDLLEGQQLELDGENVTVSAITIEDNALVPRSEIAQESQICKVYTSISPCKSDQECRQVDGGEPVCKDIKEGELTLILGLSLGLGLPMMIGIALLACFLLHRKHQEDKNKERDQSESSDVTPASYLHKTENPPRSWIIPRLQTGYDSDGFNIYGARSIDYNDNHSRIYNDGQHYYRNNDGGLRRTVVN